MRIVSEVESFHSIHHDMFEKCFTCGDAAGALVGARESVRIYKKLGINDQSSGPRGMLPVS